MVGRFWRIGSRRWWRPLFLSTVAYAGLVILSNTVVIAGMIGVRLAGGGYDVEDRTLRRIHNFRIVDDRLWVGAQASEGQYRQLAARGVTLVVDLKTGAPGDERDDPAFIRSLGMDYVWLPVTDGHAPDADSVRRFLAAVRSAPGLVYLHCGGGVGRSSALQAAYEAARGLDPSVVDALSLGPLTVEQVWYIHSAASGRLPEGNPLVAALSRFVFDGPRTAANWLADRIF